MTVAVPKSSAPTPPPLRCNRDFQLFWVGSAISMLGSRASSVAYPLLVLAMTGSAADAGLVGFAATVPYLVCQLPFGALADRWNRRRVLIAADVGRGGVLAAVAVTIAFDVASVPWLVAAAFVEGALTVLAAAAEPAAIRNLVHPAHLTTALARQEARDRAALLAGQPLGGALFAVARAVPFLVDAVTYLASLVALLLIRTPMQQPGEPRDSSARVRFRADVLRGASWLWRHRFFRYASLLVAGSNLVFQALTLVLIVLVTEQGASPFVVGAVLAGSGVGGVLGAMAAPWLRRRLSLTATILVAHWVWAVLTPLFVVFDEPLPLAVVFAAVAFVGPIWNVAVGSARLAATPDELQGKVTTASKLATYGALPIGALLGGLVLDGLGSRAAVLGVAATMLVLAILATASRSIRHPGTPSTQE